MNPSLSLLLTKFKLELRMEHLPAELGGYFSCSEGKKQIVVNESLPYERKVEISFELIFKHCLDERNSAFIPCYLLEDTVPAASGVQGKYS